MLPIQKIISNKQMYNLFKNKSKMKKTILVIAAAVLMATAQACSNRSSHNHESATATETAAKGTHATLTVQGNCGMCKKRIETAAKSVEGVTFAQWDSATKTLHLNYDESKTSPAAISKAGAAAGYDTEKDKANDDVYNALPGCCKYRK
jgi:Cu(I)/Ag(I) efflux system membrane fusion protein